MASSPKYQVFISSTYEDLREERDQVIRAVLEMGHIPVGMEMFSAADEEQWKIIARHIEESDYYAVVLAHRLGSLTDGGISYTRKEYEYAVAKGIPVLGFVIDDKASWPADRVDSSSGTAEALSEFKSLVKSKPVSSWASADDLYGRFSVALMKAFIASPREGWVRASNVGAGPEVTAEVVRLSSENALLREKLAEARDASDKEQREQVTRAIRTLLGTQRQPSYRYTAGGEWHDDSEVTLFSVFHSLGREMLIEASVAEMANTLAMTIRVDKDKSWDVVALNQVRHLLADLMTLELVQPSTRKHAVSDTAEYWSLSPFGNDVMKVILKINLSEINDTPPPSDESSNSDAVDADVLTEGTPLPGP